jgi:hypothetical protein
LDRNRIEPSQPSVGDVVLALDQTGHGYSAPPAFANSFGGPDGLAHPHSLDIADGSNIVLEATRRAAGPRPLRLRSIEHFETSIPINQN